MLLYYTDSAGSTLDSGDTTDNSFETSEFKTVGRYTLFVTESDCNDISFARVAEQKVGCCILVSLGLLEMFYPWVHNYITVTFLCRH